MTIQKFEIGRLYRVIFLDHAEGDDAYQIRLVGELVAKHRRSITLGCWLVDGKYERDNPNNHVYTILRSTILSVEELTPATGSTSQAAQGERHPQQQAQSPVPRSRRAKSCHSPEQSSGTSASDSTG
jgi:hypothetical protein